MLIRVIQSIAGRGLTSCYLYLIILKSFFLSLYVDISICILNTFKKLFECHLLLKCTCTCTVVGNLQLLLSACTCTCINQCFHWLGHRLAVSLFIQHLHCLLSSLRDTCTVHVMYTCMYMYSKVEAEMYQVNISLKG